MKTTKLTTLEANQILSKLGFTVKITAKNPVLIENENGRYIKTAKKLYKIF